MIGKFLSGASVGALVGSGLLAVVSLVMPPPHMARHPGAGMDSAGKPGPGTPPVAEAGPVAPVAEVTPEVGPKAEVTPQPSLAAPEAAAEIAAPESEGAASEPVAHADGGDLADAIAEVAPSTSPDAPAALAPKPSAEVEPQTPSTADMPLIGGLPSVPPALSGDAVPSANETPAKAPDIAAAPAPDAPELPEPVEGAAVPSGALADAAEPLPSPAPPEAPAAPLAEASPPPAENAGLPPLTPEEEAMLAQIAKDGPGAGLPQIEAAPDAAAPMPEASSEAGAASVLPSTPALAEAGEGVTTDRLPRIGDETGAPAAETAADTTAAELPPIKAFAADFENPEGKPVFAIVLIDEGAVETDRAALAALPFPVSFALDPSDPKAPEYAALYRAAGREVVMLASALPKGGQASDIEVAMAAMADVLPEAVAVMDLPERVFQSDRPLATLVVPVVGATGRGLLTWDQGLNAADQTARREDIPASVVFRDLDNEAESVPVIRRYLDRAAFKASQEGRVTVVGRTKPETVAALLEWALEGRAATVALAPLTAVLKVD